MSHTSTEQWQSFEMRMRRRRAERCRLRAMLALQAGFPGDARVALEEARLLDSSIPDFETFAATIEPVERKKRGVWPAVASVAVVALAVAALGDGRAEPAIDPPTASAAAAPAPVEPPQSHVQAEAIRMPPGSHTTAEKGTKEEETNTVRATPLPKLNATSPAATTGVSPLLPQIPEPEPKTAAPETGMGGLDAGARNVAPDPPIVEPVATPVVPPPSETTPPDHEAGIRAVLDRYAAAYSSLDASAAHAVWPTVDAQSLARAFAALDSQRVSLGTCAITVDGDTARAECRGSASWTPKIGGGLQSEPRTWRFELANQQGEWRIARAVIR